MRLPAVRARKVVVVLNKFGFREKRQTGSHLILQQEKSGIIITVPLTGKRDLKRGTLRVIIGQAGLNVKEFLKEL